MKGFCFLVVGAALLILVSARSVSKELIELTNSLNNRFDFGESSEQEFFDALGVKYSLEDQYDSAEFEDYRDIFEDDGEKKYQDKYDNYDEIERTAGNLEPNEDAFQQKGSLYNNEAHVNKAKGFAVNNLAIYEDLFNDYSSSEESNGNTNEENETGDINMKGYFDEHLSSKSDHVNHEGNDFYGKIEGKHREIDHDVYDESEDNQENNYNDESHEMNSEDYIESEEQDLNSDYENEEDIDNYTDNNGNEEDSDEEDGENSEYDEYYDSDYDYNSESTEIDNEADDLDEEMNETNIEVDEEESENEEDEDYEEYYDEFFKENK